MTDALALTVPVGVAMAWAAYLALGSDVKSPEAHDRSFTYDDDRATIMHQTEPLPRATSPPTVPASWADDQPRTPPVVPQIFHTETVTLPNGKPVYFVMEALTPEWERFTDVADVAFSGSMPLSQGAATAKAGSTKRLGGDWNHIEAKMQDLAKTDTGALDILSNLGGGITGFRWVSLPPVESHASWLRRRYVTYATDVPVTAPLVHGPPILNPYTTLKTGAAVSAFLDRYAHVLMVMTTADVPDTPFFFNRGITRMPTHVLEGRRKEYPTLSMHMHSFSARTALRFWTSKEWLLVSALESMSAVLSKEMPSDAYRVEDDIPADLRSTVKDIANSYGKGSDDKDTIIDAHRMASWTPSSQ